MRRPGPTHAKAAFTLIEVMLVVVIVGGLAALTLPRLGGSIETARLKQGAREVSGTLRFTRNLAVLREKPVEVRFDIDADRYELVMLDDWGERIEFDDLDEDDAAHHLISRGDIGGVRTLPNRTHFSVIFASAPLTEDTGRPRVIYYPDGSASPATIGIRGRGNRGFTVEVFQTTGMTRVLDGLPEKPTLEDAPRLIFSSERD